MRSPVTTGREEVGSEASTRMRRAAAAALAGAAFLVGAAVAMADPGPSANGSTTTAPPPPPPSTGGSSSPATTPSTPTTPTTPKDDTPPPRARGLKVSAPKPGQIVLTWTLVHPSDIAHVFVLRKPARHCPTFPLQRTATQIGSLNTRSRQVDSNEQDTTRYCYAVFTLDAAGNWASPATLRARNPGDQTPPAVVTGLTTTVGRDGAVTLAWTNPPDAAHDLVVRGPGSTCPHFPSDGSRVGTRRQREAQVDGGAPLTGTFCYAVYAFDSAGNRSPIVTAPVTVASTPTSTQGSSPALPPSQSGSSGSSLPDIVGIIGGGAIVLAGLAYATLRVVRREWEWHSRTGYGIRDLMSVDVRDYDRTALVIPAIIGLCIAGAVVLLLMSL